MKQRNGCVLFCLIILTIAASSCGKNNEWKEASRSFYADADIVMSQNTLSLLESSTANLTVSRNSADLLTYTFTWSSSDTSVATVDASGLVTGISGGDCTIYATCDQTEERGECSTHVMSTGTMIQSLTFTPDTANTNTLEALDPIFTTATTSYLYAPVKYKFGTLSVFIQTVKPASKIAASLNGTGIGTGTGRLNLAINILNVGSNTLKATVTSEDGHSSSYQVTIFRAVPIFKTGQTPATAVDPRDDGNLQKGVDWPTTRFTSISSNVIIDNMTGLQWNTTLNPQDLRSTIPTLTPPERIPNIRELRSLINYGEDDSALWIKSKVPSSGITSVGNYWSSQDIIISDTPKGWIISFLNGITDFATLASMNNTYLTVSLSSNLLRTGGSSSLSSAFDDYGIAWPAAFSRFARHGNAITDRATGLVWYYESLGTADWRTALAVSTAPDGSTGWRVPNINEFESLIEYTDNPSTTLNSHGFEVANFNHWSSTSKSGVDAYAVILGKGQITLVSSGIFFNYLLVRGSSE